MQINEIFSSIEGEGIRSGYLATFIRTQFCNLRCKFCDSQYTWEACDLGRQKQFVDMSIEEILKKCKEFGNKRITFTGGEPLIQLQAKELISCLLDEGYEVNIETNGAVAIEDFVKLDKKLNMIVTMDWKSPYSGERDKMIVENLKYLRSQDVLKFVVANQEDLDDMKKTIKLLDKPCNIFVSPVFGEIQGKDIVKYLKDNNRQNVRIQLQIHKFLWDPNKRGV